MDLGAILIVLSIVLLVAFFIGKPLFDRDSIVGAGTDQRRSSLLAEQEQVLDALQELDFDYRLGKIPDGDYPAARTRLLNRGAEILRDLDAHHVKLAARRPPVSDAIEQAIARRRAEAGAGPRTPVAADDDVERLIAARRREKTERSAGFCPQCGQAIQQSDKFCSKCGTSL